MNDGTFETTQKEDVAHRLGRSPLFWLFSLVAFAFLLGMFDAKNKEIVLKSGNAPLGWHGYYVFK